LLSASLSGTAHGELETHGENYPYTAVNITGHRGFSIGLADIKN
jgi:hypothetical protein